MDSIKFFAQIADVAPERVLAACRAEPDTEQGDVALEVWEKLRAVARPVGLYTRVPVTLLDEGIQLGSRVESNPLLRHNLAGCREAYPYVATCGEEADAVMQQLTDPLEQYLADEQCKLLVGLASAQLHDELNRLFNEGKPLSSVNPGSLVDWPLSGQQVVFGLLGDVAGQIGVRLTDSYLMLPVKSVSGIYFRNQQGFVNCRLCPKANCPNRRAAYDEPYRREFYGTSATGGE